MPARPPARRRARGTGSSVGFLADVRRMNVALTRARRSLWVIGHRGTLEGCPPWRDLLGHCRWDVLALALPDRCSALLQPAPLPSSWQERLPCAWKTPGCVHESYIA